jgi:hypothetical protein
MTTLTRRRFLLATGATLLSSGLGCRELTNTQKLTLAARPIVESASRWLWSQQAANGSWPSAVYGLTRSGQALTPFVLHTLLQVPEGIVLWPDGGVDRALDFIRKTVDDQGVLGRADPDILEYPNYATSYALRCLATVGSSGDADLIAAQREYLLSEQFTEQRGIEPSHPAYGSWGFGEILPKGRYGHIDLAHTRRVLQALRSSAGNDQEALEKANRFLSVVQKRDQKDQPTDTDTGYDGGFYFSPIVREANKASRAEGIAQRSYVTCTLDGLLAMQATGEPADSPWVQAAQDWLARHPGLDSPGGIPDSIPEPWAAALHYYHLAARGEYALTSEHDREAWRPDFLRILQQEQRPDGSFANSMSSLQKEDDPLVATPQAVIAAISALGLADVFDLC